MANPRVIFRSPTSIRGDVHHAPLIGLYVIRDVLATLNIKATVLDSLIEPDITPEEIAQQYDFLGQSSYYHSLIQDIEFCNKVKKINPNIFVLFGGPGAALDIQTIMDYSLADGIYQGNDVSEIAKIIKGDYANAKGLIWRPQGKPKYHSSEVLEKQYNAVIWNTIPFDKYWQILDDLKQPHDNIIRLCTSSYCVKSCSFCCHSALKDQIYEPTTMKHCYLSNETLIQLLTKINKMVPAAKQIFFQDDDFFLYPERKLFFYELITAGFNKYKYIILTSEQSIMPMLDEASFMFSAGVRKICIGVENIASRILHKISDRTQLYTIAKTLIDHGIDVYCCMILFTPDETLLSLQENISFCQKIREIGGEVGITLGVWALKGSYLERNYQSNIVNVKLENMVIPYKTVLSVWDSRTNALYHRIREKIDNYHKNITFKSKETYADFVLDEIEKELGEISPKEIYQQIR